MTLTCRRVCREACVAASYSAVPSKVGTGGEGRVHQHGPREVPLCLLALAALRLTRQVQRTARRSGYLRRSLVGT